MDIWLQEYITDNYIFDNWYRILLSSVPILVLAMTLYGVYYIVKVIIRLFYFCNTVYEYKPDFTHLRTKASNKLYGRVNKKNGESEDLPCGVPNGWYFVMAGYELKNEEVKHVSMCGLELAVFRDAHGDVHALDAFCPHLGANLAIGGKVKGRCIECPFHSWMFNGEDGKCTHIPSAKKIPDIARTKSWPILERNLVIMLWYDAEDREPMWLPKEFDEIYQDSWVIHGRGEHIMHAHISEIPENGADIGHFNPVHKASVVHGSSLDDINKDNKANGVGDHLWSNATWKVCEEESHIAQGTLQHDLTIYSYKLPLALCHTRFEQIGPAMVYLSPNCPAFGKMLLIQFVVPLETFKQKVIHITLGENSLYGKVKALAGLRLEACMVERDAVLWNNKIYRQKGVMSSTPADELIVKFRRWYSQFYSKNSRVTNHGHQIDLSW